jgi:hypothetical protein
VGSTASWALGCRRLRKDDDTVGLGMARVDGVAGSRTAPGA